jgi:hypothetical protein
MTRRLLAALLGLFLLGRGAAAQSISGAVGAAPTVPTFASTGLPSTLTSNPGTYTLANSAAGIVLSGPDQGADAINATCMAAPTPPYTIIAQDTVMSSPTASGTASDSFGGLAWSDGTKYIAFGNVVIPGGPPAIPSVYSINYPTNVGSAASVNGGSVAVGTPTAWQSISDDGTNATQKVSVDGVNWATLSHVAKSSGYLGTNGYAYVCFFASGHAGSIIETLNAWKQTSP